MRKALIALLLVGCGSDSFSNAEDSGGSDSAIESSDDAALDAGGDGSADAIADGGSGDAAKDAKPALCTLPPAPVTALDGDQCAAVNDPTCPSNCATDAGAASHGYVCKPSGSAGDVIPEWLRPTCFLSTTDAGPGRTSYCCSRAVCVRLKSSDGLCLQGPRPYAYSCPQGVVALKNCDGGACNCNATTDSTVQCCDLAGP